MWNFNQYIHIKLIISIKIKLQLIYLKSIIISKIKGKKKLENNLVTKVYYSSNQNLIILLFIQSKSYKIDKTIVIYPFIVFIKQNKHIYYSWFYQISQYLIVILH